MPKVADKPTKSKVKIESFLRAFHPDSVFEIRAFKAIKSAGWPGNPKVAACWFNDPAKAAEVIEKYDLAGLAPGEYFTINPTIPSLYEAANEMEFGIASTTADDQIVKRNWFPIDIEFDRPPNRAATDAENEATFALAVKVIEYLGSLGFVVPIFVFSGNGYHLYYRIDLPTESDLVARCLAGLSEKFSTDEVKIDTTVSNAARIMRIPGTMNRKGKDFKGSGDLPARPWRRSKILEFPDNMKIIPPDVLEKVAEQPKPVTPAPSTSRSPRKGARIEKTPESLRAYIESHGSHGQTVTGEKQNKGWTKLLLSCCPVCGRQSENPSDIAVFVGPSGFGYENKHNGCQDHNHWSDVREACEPGWNESVRTYVERRKKEIRDEFDKPMTVINDRDLSKMTEEVIGQMIDANTVEGEFVPALFTQDGNLARIKSKKDDDGERSMIEKLDDDTMRNYMAETSLFERVTKPKGSHDFTSVKVSPPSELIKNVLSCPSYPDQIPVITGIVENPILRQKGTILDTPGFDEATGLFYAPTRDLRIPDIPNEPAFGDAMESLAVIEDIICDFPWADDSSKANYIGGLLTSIVRDAISGCVPLEVLKAPVWGTGKTLLAELKSIIVTGRQTGLFGDMPSSNDELRKQITSALVLGQRDITWDNVTTSIRHGSLAALLTCDVWNDRILGQTKMVSLKNRTICGVSANNPVIEGECARRWYGVRIDTGEADPHKRTKKDFRHYPLKPYVREHRGEILAALLTIARAWFVAGKPSPTASREVMGSFEEWQEMIGGILDFIGLTDFLGDLDEAAKEADIEKSEWGMFLAAVQWAQHIADPTAVKDGVGAPITTKEMRTLINYDSSVRARLPEDLADYLERNSFTQRLGRALGNRTKKIHHGGYVVRRADTDTNANTILWEISGQDQSMWPGNSETDIV